jgi:hypothetical protein
MRMRYIILPSVVRLAVPFCFPHYLLNWMIFEKISFEYKMIIFIYNFVYNISPSTMNSARCYQKWT